MSHVSISNCSCFAPSCQKYTVSRYYISLKMKIGYLLNISPEVELSYLPPFILLSRRPPRLKRHRQFPPFERTIPRHSLRTNDPSSRIDMAAVGMCLSVRLTSLSIHLFRPVRAVTPARLGNIRQLIYTEISRS